MKKILFLVAAVLLFGMTSLAQTITKPFPVSSFQGISAGGVFNVELTKSSLPSVIILTDKEIMPFVEVKVVRGVLVLSLDGERIPSRLRRDMGPIKAKVTIKEELNDLSLSGASEFSTTARFSPASFNVEISGASNAKGLYIESQSATINVSGASSLDIKGKFTEAEYEISGASSVIINQDINKLDLECSGATKVSYSGKSNSISAECSGATFTKMTGECVTMSAEVSGASKLDALGFKVLDMNIEVTGVSSSKIYVERSLDVEVSGGSILEYKGSAQIKSKDISSISSFKKIN